MTIAIQRVSRVRATAPEVADHPSHPSGRPFLRWRDTWLVDVPFMDRDHLALADQINILAARFGDCGDSREQGRDVEEGLIADLVRLGDDTRAHFAREEAVMRATDYPGLTLHKREHDCLLAELALLCRELSDAGTMRLDAATLDSLKCWLIGHVLGDDRELAAHIRRCKALTGELVAAFG